jgi:adenylosuccinate synthase
MLVDPLALAREAELLAPRSGQEVYGRLSIDPRCVVVTPFHRILNQMRELARGAARHGSCGRGVAEAQLDSERGGLPVVRMGELADPERLLRALRLLWLVKIDQAEQLCEQHPQEPGLPALLADLRQPHRVQALVDEYVALAQKRGITLTCTPPPAEVVVFEGAQGVLLDRDHGFYPHVTPSRTTMDNALCLLADWAPRAECVRVGVLRAYATRHGAGPLPTEDAELQTRLPEPHNAADPWAGSFRAGWFDAVLARYALRTAAPIDALVLTCVDRMTGLGPLRVAESYTDPAGGPLVRELVADATDRAALAARLFALRPSYRQLPGWDAPGGIESARSYVEQLAELCGCPVAAVSLGPTAQDKQVLAAPAPL